MSCTLNAHRRFGAASRLHTHSSPCEALIVTAAMSFSAEQRTVGIFQERLGIHSVIRIYTDSDTYGNVHILLLDVVGCAQRGEQLARTEGRIFWAAHFRQENHEFIPTLATDGVRASHASRQASRNRLQKLIADRMTQGVVDMLEVIHIHEQHCKGRAVTVRRRYRLRQ